ncbi:MAG: hypothetical protein OEW75_01250 [Cyclobacteriaceae bacterium]|nr:hypothetical protein [Cyclobacteriaceae bacterium]
MPYYYPFGMEITERSKVKQGEDGYRYALPAEMKCRLGFQGQEEDSELGYVNYKYRMHDPKIGRFFSVDPLASKYPYNSPYAFSENRVIDGVEIDGLEVAILGY